MKFFTAILLVAFVAVAYAAEEAKPVKEVETKDAGRGKRGYVLGTYAAPIATAPIAAPVVTAYSAPVAHTYSAALPHPYSPYYSHPVIYV